MAIAETDDGSHLGAKHVAFNPQWSMPGRSLLEGVCNEQAEDGWQLVRVVPVHEFEAIAVFERGCSRCGWVVDALEGRIG